MRLKLREIRKNKGLSLRELSKKIQMTPNTIYRWEAGDFFPKPKNLKRLSEVLEVPVSELIEDTPGEAKDGSED